MNSRLIPAMIFMFGVLSGCATNSATPDRPAPAATSAGEGVCDADPAQSAIGRKVDNALIETARQQAGAKTARALRPDDVITTEYNSQRLNLRVDEHDTVVSVSCG